MACLPVAVAEKKELFIFSCFSCPPNIPTWQSWVRSLLGGLASDLPPSRPPPLTVPGVAARQDFSPNFSVFLNFNFKMFADFGQLKCLASEDMIVMRDSVMAV